MRYLLSYSNSENEVNTGEFEEKFQLSFHDYHNALETRAKLIKDGFKNVHVYKEIITYEKIC